MVQAGEVLANPVSGERMRFVRTAADTGGCLLEWDHILAPGARVPAEHIHRVQQERFEVLAGTARVRCARDSFDLHKGGVRRHSRRHPSRPAQRHRRAGDRTLPAAPGDADS